MTQFPLWSEWLTEMLKLTETKLSIGYDINTSFYISDIVSTISRIIKNKKILIIRGHELNITNI